MVNFDELRRKSPGHRAARIFRSNAWLMDRKVSELGLCHGQLPYLVATLEKEGQTQDELATYIRVNRAATARTLKAMEKAGLVTRKENPENRRQKLVYPTAKAKTIINDVIGILDAHNAMMLDGFSDEERTTLFSLMDRVIDNLDKAVSEDSDDHG